MAATEAGTPANVDESAGEAAQAATYSNRSGDSAIRRRSGGPDKSVEDFYKESNDSKAVRDLEYSEVHKEFPMLCFCSSDGPQKPSGFCRLVTKEGHRGRIPFYRKAIWAFPAFGWFALKYFKTGYMHKFYLDDYPKASLGIIAFTGVLSVLIDAFTDPKMAGWTDNLRSRFGRRRPFVFASVFFVPFAMVLAWLPVLVPPGLGASLWYGVFHIMFKLADTLFTIPFDAWGAQLTPIYKEKTSIWQLKDVFANVGVLFGLAVLPFFLVTSHCTSTPESGCWELPMIAMVFAAIFMAGALLLVWKGKEPPIRVSTRPPSGPSTEDTIPMLISTFLNKPFRMLLVTDVVKAVGHDIPFIVLPFMTAWVVGEKCFAAGEFFNYLVLGNLVCGLMGVPAWTYLARKTSKYKAYFIFNCALATTSLSMVFLNFDSGDCTMSYVTMILNCLFGFTYGGTFLLADMVSDVIDYDELLTGGLRREASYLMAVEFIPKFMSIPGECVPFLLMAYFNYARPLKEGQQCGVYSQDYLGVTPDDFCHSFYTNVTGAADACSGSLSCQELLDNGVTFICNHALGGGSGQCGIKQNGSVRTTLLLCFSIVPCLFVLGGVVALWFYPKEARSEATQEKVVQAVSLVKRGQTVDDPWRPGSKISPAEPATEHSGALSYFWPHELKRVAQASADEVVDVSHLLRKPVVLTVVFALFLPIGALVVGAGFEDLSDDLGASVSPLGLMIIGIGLCGGWFNGVRVWVAMRLRRSSVTRREVIAKYNALCPFTGHQKIEA